MDATAQGWGAERSAGVCCSSAAICGSVDFIAMAPMVALLATTLIASSSASSAIAATGQPAPQGGPACAVSKVFVGTAPSDIYQQKFEARFEQPLNRVDCRDNGLCYQTWGKGCTKATN